MRSDVDHLDAKSIFTSLYLHCSNYSLLKLYQYILITILLIFSIRIKYTEHCNKFMFLNPQVQYCTRILTTILKVSLSLQKTSSISFCITAFDFYFLEPFLTDALLLLFVLRVRAGTLHSPSMSAVKWNVLLLGETIKLGLKAVCTNTQ